MVPNLHMPNPDPEFDVATAFKQAAKKLTQVLDDFHRANDEAEARLHRSCPELRGEAFHRLLRKDEELQSKLQAFPEAIAEFRHLMARRDMRRWAKTNISPSRLKGLERTFEHVSGTLERELGGRLFNRNRD